MVERSTTPASGQRTRRMHVHSVSRVYVPRHGLRNWSASRNTQAMTSNALTVAAAAEIRAECARQRLNYRELARLVGRPNTTVYRWINAETPMTLNDFGLLAEALGVDPAALLARATLVVTEGRESVAVNSSEPRDLPHRRQVSGGRRSVGNALTGQYERSVRCSSVRVTKQDDWRIREESGSHVLPILLRRERPNLRSTRFNPVNRCQRVAA